jgi:hypothetical protein
MGRRFDVVQTEAWPDKRHYAGRAGQPVHCDPQKPKQTHQARYGQDHPLPVRVLHSNVPRGKTIKDLPQIARRSITFDRGSEFMNWPHLQAEIGTQTWFCDPSNPWQKGTVENTNRRARRWLPRKRDIRSMTDHDMKEICDRLNNTPRKCLGWKTPAEVFREKMLEEMR